MYDQNDVEGWDEYVPTHVEDSNMSQVVDVDEMSETAALLQQATVSTDGAQKR